MLAQDFALPDTFFRHHWTSCWVWVDRGSEPSQASLQVDQTKVSQRRGRERAHWLAENT